MPKHSLEPQNIDDTNWYYEEKRGIEVIHEVWLDGRKVRTDHILIPWRKVLASVNRHRTS